jgi:uncharacterized repeat protein (TIGR03809 family)
MSDHQPFSWLDDLGQRWRVLAERRRAHFIDLFNSGRWKHYYSEQQFLLQLREAIQLSERWAMIAPPPEAGAATGDEAAADQHRAAAASADDAAAVVEEPAPADVQRSAA